MELLLAPLPLDNTRRLLPATKLEKFALGQRQNQIGSFGFSDLSTGLELRELNNELMTTMKKAVTDTWTDKVSEEANNRDAPLEKFKSSFALTVHAVGIQKKKKKVKFTNHDNFLISAWIFW